jgi:hypothetical protein
MILPAYTVPDAIVKRLPEARAWVEQARNEGLVSIGVVGEAVHVLPGFLDSIDVSSSLLEDSVEQEGKSGSVKIIHGWKDCDVSINLILLDIPILDVARCRVTPAITRHDCLAQIAALFKKMTDGKPQIYTVHHPHLTAWGARQFIFAGLKSSESRSKGIITCALEFDEFDSTIGKSQDRHIGLQQAEQSAASVTEKAPVVSDHTRRGLGALEERYAGI